MGAARHTAKASKAKWAVGSLNVETEAEHTKLQKSLEFNRIFRPTEEPPAQAQMRRKSV